MASERQRGAGVLADAVLTLSQVAETLRKLEFILEDYEAARQGYMTALGDPGNIPDMNEVPVLLALRVETFYLFARILLDQIARVVRGAFGSAGTKKVPLSGHTELRKNLACYAAQKGLKPVPDSLTSLIERVSSDIVDFRDDYVTHDAASRRIKATMFDRSTGSVSVVISTLMPREGETEVTAYTPPELMETIDTYVTAVIDYITLNRKAERPAGGNS